MKVSLYNLNRHKGKGNYRCGRLLYTYNGLNTVVLKSDSICHLLRYMATMVSMDMSKSLVSNDTNFRHFLFLMSTNVITRVI